MFILFIFSISGGIYFYKEFNNLERKEMKRLKKLGYEKEEVENMIETIDVGHISNIEEKDEELLKIYLN